ncbi:hypothetical protein D3C84_781760 [compost metagenome]
MLRGLRAPNKVLPDATITKNSESSSSAPRLNARLNAVKAIANASRAMMPASGDRLQATHCGRRIQYAAAMPPRKLARKCFFSECSQPTTWYRV